MVTPLLKRKRAKRVGEPPGSLIPSSPGAVAPVRKALFSYDGSSCRETFIDGDIDFHALQDPATRSWLNIDGIRESHLLEQIGAGLGIHPLALEDIQNPDLRPKIENYGGFLFLSCKMLRWDKARGEISSEQVSLLVGKSWVVSFQEEREGDVFGVVRERIRSGKGRIRSEGADYLAYSLLDAVVDHYFLVLEQLEEAVDGAENRMVGEASAQPVTEIQRLVGLVALVRRAVWPLREIVLEILKEEYPLVAQATYHYFRDVYDHLLEVADTVDLLRDMLAGLLNLQISSLSKNLNAVMKVLTIIATIFMPLSFIASLYGMNFHYMPELSLRWGYPAVLGLMAGVTIGMIIYFKRKKWL